MAVVTKRANEVDRLVGQRIREVRKQKGISQEHLGKGAGVSFQQVQKYENGTNRVSVGRLVEIALTLDVNVFDLIPSKPIASPKRRRGEARIMA